MVFMSRNTFRQQDLCILLFLLSFNFGLHLVGGVPFYRSPRSNCLSAVYLCITLSGSLFGSSFSTYICFSCLPLAFISRLVARLVYRRAAHDLKLLGEGGQEVTRLVYKRVAVLNCWVKATRPPKWHFLSLLTLYSFP